MDKNTLLGLGLIGAIMVTFSILFKPEAKEAKPAGAKTEKVSSQEEKSTGSGTTKEQDKVQSTTDNKATTLAVQAEKVIRMETDKAIYEFSTKGAIVSSVYLKEFESYRNFAKKDGKIVPLKLFGEGDNTNQLSLTLNGKPFKTGNKNFQIAEQTADRIVFELKTGENQNIQFVYSLHPEKYDLDYEIKLNGYNNGEIAPNSVFLKWDTDLYKTERLLSSQRMVSTVMYKYKEGKHDWLKEGSDDYEDNFDKNLSWVAFKQSYFSSIMAPSEGFSKEGSSFKITNFKEGDPKYHTHIKRYKSIVNLNFSNTSNASAKINWFFGPNEYELLKSYDKDFDDILNFGWGIFRWINLYAIQPLFSLLSQSGLNYGLVILLLTLIIKVILMPIQWKMFVSSAKMKILKPDIDALNEKYPKQEDAMKKQMEMMTIYRESGASPFSGCLPMLIQMPILLAVFRFFPAAFDLRQQSFLWAEDLSSYDSVFDFGFYIPLYGDHISLFTLLMAATTIIYTWLNSGNMQQPQQPGMPNMKVIMYIFPFMMIFFFNNYSAGLSYYYFISTLISIILMIIIKNFIVDEEKLKNKMATQKASNTANGGSKKSKLQERLEMMQKAQLEAKKKSKK